MSRLVCVGLSDGVATKYYVQLRGERKEKKKLNTEFLVLEWLGISTPSMLLDYEGGSLTLQGVQGKELFW